MNHSYPVVTLKPRKDQSLLRFHPWVFSGAVASMRDNPHDGDVVRVCSSSGACLGVGHFQSAGSIRVRMLAFDDCPVDNEFWLQKIAGALQTRRILGLVSNPDTNAWRLIHGEGDGLPGLIIDWYDGNAVIQPHSSGMSRAVPEITATLQQLFGDSLRSVSLAGSTDQSPDLPQSCEICEYGHRFIVDWHLGQKTGFFLDQRENRRLFSRLSAGKTVLNAFSYSGGFSIYALKAGAELVHSLDSSKQALAWAEQNVSLNNCDTSRHTCIQADAVQYLKKLPHQYDLIVLDPPAFAKHQSARHNAIQAYRRINACAISQIAPGGIIFTFSCSQAVTEDLFRGAVLAAGIDARRNVRILHHLHQAPDHPVCLYHPEGNYLKGLVLQIS